MAQKSAVVSSPVGVIYLTNGEWKGQINSTLLELINEDRQRNLSAIAPDPNRWSAERAAKILKGKVVSVVDAVFDPEVVY